MMNVIIKESGTRESLSIIDVKTGVDYISDFVGNWGALGDGQFEYDEEDDAFICDQDTYDWWVRVVLEHQELDERITELENKYGLERVHEVVASAGDHNDLADIAPAVNDALDEAFPE